MSQQQPTAQDKQFLTDNLPISTDSYATSGVVYLYRSRWSCQVEYYTWSKTDGWRSVPQYC